MGRTEPQGVVRVDQGGILNISITPDNYYFIAEVNRNEVSVGAVSNLYLNNVTEEGAIDVRFAAEVAARGTPHWWLAKYGLTNSVIGFNEAERTDPDADGFDNNREWICDTDPIDGDSRFVIFGKGSNHEMTILIPSSPDRTYTLYQTENLQIGRWIEVDSKLGTGSLIEFICVADVLTNTLFFRVSVEAP